MKPCAKHFAKPSTEPSQNLPYSVCDAAALAASFRVRTTCGRLCEKLSERLCERMCGRLYDVKNNTYICLYNKQICIFCILLKKIKNKSLKMNQNGSNGDIEISI